MANLNAMHSLTLYFLGQGRPLYLEAGDYDLAAAKLFRSIRDMEADKREKVTQWAHSINEQRGRYSAMSCEFGALGLSWRIGEQDKAFCGRMAGFPDYPGIDYSADVTAVQEGN